MSVLFALVILPLIAFGLTVGASPAAPSAPLAAVAQPPFAIGNTSLTAGASPNGGTATTRAMNRFVNDSVYTLVVTFLVNGNKMWQGGATIKYSRTNGQLRININRP